MENIIDQSLCKKCGICAEVCPNKIIGQNGSIHFKNEREHLCLQCGQCMAVCPTKSIQIKGLSYNDFLELRNGKSNYESFMEVLAGRRSVRNFKNQPVRNELVDEIVNSVSYAPFGAAPEKMEISVINSREKIESVLPLISDFFLGLEKMVENPISSIFLRLIAGKENFHTVKNHIYPIAKGGNYNLENGDGITRGAPCLITIHASKNAEAHTNNGVIYATYMMLAAHAVGLGATMIECIIPAINRNNKLKQFFQIPEKNEAIMSIIVGHPKYRFKRTIKRKKHKVHKVE
ncbi:nitroreductase family protein [uncultured Draconibacterium sp.]|uniref:nitroreductase family protein n=1 Tax=uncultured Draconibacterium sp. TaxID=1573823 RepID=UPI002AA64674|nr:nitroreductase family protein [uncultured Draconibacterium sp.]